MIRELAENPNVHQPLAPGRELYRDPDGRFVLYRISDGAVFLATTRLSDTW